MNSTLCTKNLSTVTNCSGTSMANINPLITKGFNFWLDRNRVNLTTANTVTVAVLGTD